ncbi:hypothetical protein CNR22_03625 [Sphingobacteriaceae bacterium]|nr:hypothetical protein CNR22_03625 [Sphingobacteriaceae bacterium]
MVSVRNIRWHNTKKNKLPKDGQEVSIIADGISYIAVYNEVERCFAIKDYMNAKLSVEGVVIFWSEN